MSDIIFINSHWPAGNNSSEIHYHGGLEFSDRHGEIKYKADHLIIKDKDGRFSKFWDAKNFIRFIKDKNGNFKPETLEEFIYKLYNDKIFL